MQGFKGLKVWSFRASGLQGLRLLGLRAVIAFRASGF